MARSSPTSRGVDTKRVDKIMVIAGTRPEGVKLAPVIRELMTLAEEGGVKIQVCVTGQHREMLDQVMDLFGIVPDIDLDLMRQGQTPSELAARVLLALEPVLLAERPDWIVVQGDTTTVMASSIAAHHLRIKVGHVEAGLRTGDRLNPFPEEMNRRIVGQVGDLHFAPTETARQNLLREGVCDDDIYVTGNPVIDALLDMSSRPSPPQLKQIMQDGRRLILVTAHRRESFGEPLAEVCRALKGIAEEHSDVQIVFPVHRNPNVQGPVYASLSSAQGITLMAPMDYLTLVHLMKASYLILTDSGGIQEEAPSLGVPVLVLRETTERPEAVAAGAVRVVGTNAERIMDEARRLLNDPVAHSEMAQVLNPYGDGHAAQRIAHLLLSAGGGPLSD